MNGTNQPNLTVRRRNGSIVAFDRSRIERAIASAFLRDANGVPRHVGGHELMPAERDKVALFTELVVYAVGHRPDAQQHPIDIEDIQDRVEMALMRHGEHQIARDYLIYRERRRQQRSCQPRACARGAGQCESDCEACQ